MVKIYSVYMQLKRLTLKEQTFEYVPLLKPARPLLLVLMALQSAIVLTFFPNLLCSFSQTNGFAIMRNYDGPVLPKKKLSFSSI